MQKSAELTFYEGLYQKDPTNWEVIKLLADARTREGFYEAGLELDWKLARQFPDDSYVLYNLACSLSRSHRLEEALEWLNLSVNKGYSDWKWLMKDEDLVELRQTENFKKWLSLQTFSKQTPDP